MALDEVRADTRHLPAVAGRRFLSHGCVRGFALLQGLLVFLAQLHTGVAVDFLALAHQTTILDDFLRGRARLRREAGVELQNSVPEVCDGLGVDQEGG